MSHRPHVTVEQANSFAEALREAGHEHGDESELELVGVGVQAEGGRVHLAFCPTEVVSLKTLHCGSAKERRQPLPETVQLSQTSQLRLSRRFQNFNGFATVRCTLHSNGALHVKALRITDAKRFEGRVNTPQAYYDYQASLAAAI